MVWDVLRFIFKTGPPGLLLYKLGKRATSQIRVAMLVIVGHKESMYKAKRGACDLKGRGGGRILLIKGQGDGILRETKRFDGPNRASHQKVSQSFR